MAVRTLHTHTRGSSSRGARRSPPASLPACALGPRHSTSEWSTACTCKQ